jgi:putative FmdB family regulatory protein
MPFYDYKCCDCDHVFEAMHGMDETVDACELCGGRVKKVFHPVGIIFKGPGFYSTDCKSKSVNSANPAGNGNGNGDTPKKEEPKPKSDVPKAESTSAAAKPDSKS